MWRVRCFTRYSSRGTNSGCMSNSWAQKDKRLSAFRWVELSMFGGPPEAFESRLRHILLPHIKFMPQPNYNHRGLRERQNCEHKSKHHGHCGSVFLFPEENPGLPKGPPTSFEGIPQASLALAHTQWVLGESCWYPHIVKIYPENYGFNQMHGFIAWA